jgi:glycosyltransferase involved in cell wall biosynthesis
MPNPSAAQPPTDELPAAPPGRHTVLHTRVVTETGGGPDKTILLSAPFFADTPYWVAAAYMHPPDDPGFDAIRRRARQYGSPLISVPDRGPLDRGVFRAMLDLCRRYQVRIWHGHDYKSNLIGLSLRPFWNMKLITTVHGWVKQTTRTPLYYAIDRWTLPYYHHVICVSEDLVRRVRELNVPPERLVIGAVGRLSPEKAFNNLIRATHRLLQQGLDVELWIAGDGDSRDDLQKLIAHLGLAERVRLLGFVADTIELYHALDLFVLSSLREGLPNVVLEAMAMSVPVVSTRVAGVPNLITEGVTGLLCPVGEVEPLTQAMLAAAADPDLRRRLALAARELIEQRYTFAQRMARERAIYDKVLGPAESDRG